MLRRNLFAVLPLMIVGSLAACGGESPQSSGPTDDSVASASDAITAVQGCTSQANACSADSGKASDEDADTTENAGDAGRGDDDGCRHSMCSCLGRVHMRGDGGADFDRDGGFGASPDRAAIDACLATLHTCVSGSTSPRTCADEAVSCIEAAIGFDGGALRRPSFDGGSPFPHPTFDGGFPFPNPLEDGGRGGPRHP